ncbi:hypothetical protein LPB140_09620 [Sphingorhabdus lutea]|uniref:Dihydrofolate synthase/folylpolyglutamate synthase n=1 Tax=Sphingorhabdus lutea TaxID=1913578 RepID=A0A1L3JCZ4_9SPHN|nr:folylpolyglutamate synthase/dihydrofolate synthase family protein [Sphingorhabdus lutea]APG63006.1 hypothetical protein LPB140_09620 [Sphingorhabdus lutea]
MADYAKSTNPLVQHQLDRLWNLSPGKDVLGLERITILLERLGNPHLDLPPIFHVAGTNGKGSTIAFLRSALEAAGHKVHIYTSPHLVNFNERIRISGQLIKDDYLAQLLAQILDIAEDIHASFFEVTTAAMFLAFAKNPADACIIEVGLGGRLDATNVITSPLVTGIASLGIDHETFLLAPEKGTPTIAMERIGWEKAGIAKTGRPLIIANPCANAMNGIKLAAKNAGAIIYKQGDAWWGNYDESHIEYRDDDFSIRIALPALYGQHQAENALLATAMLRHQNTLHIPESAYLDMVKNVRWPARLQALANGPLTAPLPQNIAIWLDGGHNVDAAQRVAQFLAQQSMNGEKFILIFGMLANKDASAFINILAPYIDIFIALPIDGHDHYHPEMLCNIAKDAGIKHQFPAFQVEQAIGIAAKMATGTEYTHKMLISGSLYLAGEILRKNDQIPI